MNLEYCRRLLSSLHAAGISSFCICSGSRNSPLIVELLKDEDRFQLYNFFEERSAGFFALGLARRTGKAVAVVTTSGTAAAELLPAAIEAHYSGVPLLLITADRPARLRGTGAPQSIEQTALFKNYVELDYDLEVGGTVPTFANWGRQSPLHLNLCFDEPLFGPKSHDQHPTLVNVSRVSRSPGENLRELEQFLATYSRPLVMLSNLTKIEALKMLPFLKSLGAPIWAEATSQLREAPELQGLLIRSGERVLKYGAFDAVLRIGGIPQCRFWRDLDLNSLPVLSISSQNFTGLSRGLLLIETSPGKLFEKISPVARTAPPEFFNLDKGLYEAKLALFAEEPRSEPALFHSLSRLIPEQSRVFLGNSLPVREWDLAAVWKHKNFNIGASRGANGIEGQVSTFLGWLHSDGPENWGIFGDLTALYDLSAPWALRLLREELPVTFVVVNNQGGKIFSRLPQLRKHIPEELREKFVENSHKVDFEGWARLWNLGYEKWERIPSQLPAARQSIIEIRPDNEATDRFWLKFEKLFEVLS